MTNRRRSWQPPVDPVLDNDDLIPARANVWIVFAWIAVVAVIAILLLPGCGGGIDDAAELYGPPAPCQLDPAACHPQPS